MDAVLSRLGRQSQGLIGLSLAAAIFVAWIVLHLVAMFAVEITPATLLPVLALAAVQCWLSVGLFIVAHDAMHGSLAPGHPRLNGAIGATLLFLYAGFGWTKMRDAHFAHHKHPGSTADPDFDAHHPAHFWPWYVNFLRRYFGWRSGLYVVSVVVVYWAVFRVPFANIGLLYGLPAIASSLQLFYFGTYRPHRHDDAMFADRHNARSEDFGPVASLLSCFHFGYHHEHHLGPDVPWWRLPAQRRSTLRRTAP